jgi:hypothetical protein
MVGPATKFLAGGKLFGQPFYKRGANVNVLVGWSEVRWVGQGYDFGWLLLGTLLATKRNQAK